MSSGLLEIPKNLAIAEYVGIFPGHTSHGNNLNEVPPSTMQNTTIDNAKDRIQYVFAKPKRNI